MADASAPIGANPLLATDQAMVLSALATLHTAMASASPTPQMLHRHMNGRQVPRPWREMGGGGGGGVMLLINTGGKPHEALYGFIKSYRAI